MGRILIGISAWADRQLIDSGQFYPDSVRTPQERLRYYASEFNLAEIDASYHYFPTRANLALWIQNTPESFTFDVRAFSLFTQHPTPLSSLPKTVRDRLGDSIPARGNIYPHHLPADVLGELWNIFGQVIRPIHSAGKLGVVLFQFAPWFHPNQENYDYIVQCQKNIPDYRMAVEFRVGSWFKEGVREKTLEILRQHEIALVCVDEPQGLKSSVPHVAEVTAATGIVRFHGRNKDNWEAKGIPVSEKFNYLYGEDELMECLPSIKDMAGKTDELHLIFKNKYRDFPVRNARQMKQLLGQVSPT